MCGRSKNTIGGNLLFIGALPPILLIEWVNRLLFDGSLRRSYAGDGHAER